LFHANSRVAELRTCQVTAEGLGHLKRCPGLISLVLGPSIEWPSDEEYLCEVLSGLRNLRELRLERGGCVKSSLVSMLSQRNPNLTVVSLSGCPNVDDRCLSFLGQHCIRLESVDFSCTQITDAGVESLTSSPCGLTLKEVIVRGCRRLTNRAIESFYSECPNIAILIFSDCPLIEGWC
ncbi:unnamed protein product, partial [Ixodes hexagonus]